MTTSTHKKCTKCGETKPLDAFRKDARHALGRRSQCKQCENERVRKHYEANKEKVAKYKRKYREANKEKVAEHRWKHYEANRDRLTDWYCKKLLVNGGFPRDYITPEVVALKRAKIQIHRLTRQLNETITEAENENQ